MKWKHSYFFCISLKHETQRETKFNDVKIQTFLKQKIFLVTLWLWSDWLLPLRLENLQRSFTVSTGCGHMTRWNCCWRRHRRGRRRRFVPKWLLGQEVWVSVGVAVGARWRCDGLRCDLQVKHFLTTTQQPCLRITNKYSWHLYERRSGGGGGTHIYI